MSYHIILNVKVLLTFINSILAIFLTILCSILHAIIYRFWFLQISPGRTGRADGPTTLPMAPHRRLNVEWGYGTSPRMGHP